MRVNIESQEKLLMKIGNQSSNYPPYNFLCISKNEREGDFAACEEIYILEVAVAGFSSKYLSVTMSDRYLTIEGVGEAVTKEYLHQGIARRNFKQIFKVHDSMRLAGEAHLENGILRLMFIREISDTGEIKTIPIYITTLKIAG